MGLGDVVDEFLDQHSLSNTSTTEETNLSTTGIGGEQVDDLDTGLQDFGGCRLLNEGRRVGMNRTKLDALDRAPLVDRLANDIHDTTQSTLPNRDPDGSTGVYNLLSPD